MPAHNRRSVIRQGGFEASLQVLFHHWEDAEAFLAAAEFVLAAEAEVGMPIGDGIWIIPMAPVKNADVWLYYTYYETVVVLLDVRSFAS